MSTQVFNLKRSITFFLEKRKDESGLLISKNTPIRMSVSFNGKRIMFFTGYRIDASKWDEKRQRAKNNTTHPNGVIHTDINDQLDKLATGLNIFFKECEVSGVTPTIDNLKNQFSILRGDSVQKSNGFFAVFDLFVQTVGRENSWGENIKEKFGVARNHLTAFNKSIALESTDSNTIINYIDWLRVTRNLQNTTIKKQVSYLKWFLKWAAKNKYPVPQSALDFQPKLKGTDGSLKKVIFLTIDELKHLYAFEIPESKNYLSRVRDVFAFCCFSGLRYSDVFNLKKSDIKETHIEFVTQKTSDLLRVDLNKYSRAILNKYIDVPFAGDKALPVITNQKMNDYLKELGDLAGFDSPETIVYFRGNDRIEETYPKYALLSTHCARKTFVTNLIYMGVSDHVIRQWTGHRDTKSFDVYHKMIDEIKSREMSKFDNI